MASGAWFALSAQEWTAIALSLKVATIGSLASLPFAFGTKLEDFVLPELDFQCFANSAGQVCQLNFGDAA